MHSVRLRLIGRCGAIGDGTKKVRGDVQVPHVRGAGPAAILKEQSPQALNADPLPMAKPAGPKPPEVLPYRGKPDGFDADAMPPPHTMPLGYRVLRLALWLSVAVVSLGAMLSSVRCER